MQMTKYWNKINICIQILGSLGPKKSSHCERGIFSFCLASVACSISSLDVSFIMPNNVHTINDNHSIRSYNYRRPPSRNESQSVHTIDDIHSVGNLNYLALVLQDLLMNNRRYEPSQLWLWRP